MYISSSRWQIIPYNCLIFRRIRPNKYAMATLKKYILFLLLGSFLAVSCNENDPDDDFPSNIGITGRVNAQNEFEQPLWNERNGVEILLETGFRSFSVQGDNTGNFQLAGAPVGNYTITYSKPGFGQRIVRNVNISTTNPSFPIENGFQRIPTVTLTKLPLTEFENVNVALNELGGNNFELTISATMVPGPPANGLQKGYRVFIGNSAQLSSNNYQFQEHGISSTAELSLTYGNGLFDSLNIESGDLIYVILHGDANFDLTEEFPEGVFRFPNITAAPSEVVSVVLP